MRGLTKVARINRKLRADDECIRKARHSFTTHDAYIEAGSYCLFSQRGGFLGSIDLEGLGRELGVLRDYETVPE